MMSRSPVRFEVGSYWLFLPEHATISAAVMKPPPWAVQQTQTNWTVVLDRFQILIHLDPIQTPTSLGEFIESSTKQRVETRTVTINGIHGEMFGSYDPPRTWIDWWLKKGDLMICLSLRSKAFPVTVPTEEEHKEHDSIIHSIQFAPDHLIR